MYKAEFEAGSGVRIARPRRLEELKRNWQYHHPLADEQLAYGGYEATVKEVAFYHGGDELYTLEQVPGIWHECCLEELASNQDLGQAADEENHFNPLDR